MYENILAVTFYLMILSLPCKLSTAQPSYAIKKIEPYMDVFDDYCDLVVVVNATFVPMDMWFRKTENGGKVKLDVDNNPDYHATCEFCKNSPCEFYHWRFCRFQFSLRINMNRKERVGQYIATIGAQRVFAEHVFTVIDKSLPVITTPVATATRSTLGPVDDLEQPIVLTKQHMYIGIGVAAAILLMFIIVIVAICHIGRKRRSENSNSRTRASNRHNLNRDREPSVISNLVSNHTYADISSGIYDGLNPNTLNNKSSYAVPTKNTNYQNVNAGASNFIHIGNFTRRESSSVSDEHSYLEPQEPTAHSLTGTNQIFEEPEPIAYQLTGATNNFPSDPKYDDSAFRTKTKGPPPVLPKKTKNEPKHSNVDPDPKYDDSAFRTKTKGPPPVLPKKTKNEPKHSNIDPGNVKKLKNIVYRKQ